MPITRGSIGPNRVAGQDVTILRELAHRGKNDRRRSLPEVAAQAWVKPLANGDRAVALFNTGSSSQQITTTASAVGMPKASHYTLLNVWANQTSTTKNKISANAKSGVNKIPAGRDMYKLSIYINNPMS